MSPSLHLPNPLVSLSLCCDPVSVFVYVSVPACTSASVCAFLPVPPPLSLPTSLYLSISVSVFHSCFCACLSPYPLFHDLPPLVLLFLLLFPSRLIPLYGSFSSKLSLLSHLSLPLFVSLTLPVSPCRCLPFLPHSCTTRPCIGPARPMLLYAQSSRLPSII